jgi:sodium/bile acid cotransporter 7
MYEAVALFLLASQKSAPVAVTLISYISSDAEVQGMMAVPCITGQLAQIFIGSLMAPMIAKRVRRSWNHDQFLHSQQKGAYTKYLKCTEGI